MNILLHVGCGTKTKAQTTPAFKGPEWRELRVDIDPGVKPDLVASMTDMKTIKSHSVDAIFSSHNIEHLYPHEVHTAFMEFVRVLSIDGFAVITCPDLQSAARLIVDDKLTEEAYSSINGPITPLDILFGHGASLASGHVHMAHHGGFTRTSLVKALHRAGFRKVAALSRKKQFDLWALASIKERSDQEMTMLAQSHFPK